MTTIPLHRSREWYNNNMPRWHFGTRLKWSARRRGRLLGYRAFQSATDPVSDVMAGCGCVWLLGVAAVALFVIVTIFAAALDEAPEWILLKTLGGVALVAAIIYVGRLSLRDTADSQGPTSTSLRSVATYTCPRCMQTFEIPQDVKDYEFGGMHERTTCPNPRRSVRRIDD